MKNGKIYLKFTRQIIFMKPAAKIIIIKILKKEYLVSLKIITDLNNKKYSSHIK